MKVKINPSKHRIVYSLIPDLFDNVVSQLRLGLALARKPTILLKVFLLCLEY